MTRTRLLVFAPALLFGLVGCDPPPTSIPPGEAPAVAPGPAPGRPPPPIRPAEPIEEPPADAGAPATGPGPATSATRPPPTTGGRATSALGAVGAACDSAADCDTGICEGEGCGPKKGRCAAKNRACTRDRRPYCGCDGNTFYSSGSCPGARFSSRSACTGGGGGGGGAALAADGAACRAAADCQSGICEGEGCGAGSHAVCVSRKRPCTADLRAYCGCDGVTFNSSSSCPGRRYASRSACKK